MSLNFNATRLKEARLLRELTQPELADLIGVTKQAISQYENGIVVPRSDTIIEMAKSLQMPLAYFSMEESNPIKTPVFFRSRKTSRKKTREKYIVYIHWVIDIYVYINSLITLPKVNIIRKCQEHYSLDEIIVIAKEVRQHWGLGNGPISNLTLLLENNGFIIAKTPLQADKVDACSLYFTNIDARKNRPMIFLTSSTSAVRSRRDLAHELGHQVLHSWMDQETFEANQNNIEAEADLFASCFLMPPDAMERESFFVTTTDSLLYLKRRWGTSAQSIMYHLHTLGFLKDSLFENLKAKVYKHRWRNSEPFDNEIKQESPELLKDALNLLVDASVKNPSEISDELSFPIKDLSELCCLPEAFFNYSGQVKPMLTIVK